MNRARLGPWLLAAAVVAFLGVFLLWPLGHVFFRAFHDPQGVTTFYMRGLFTSPTQLEAIITSLWIATLVSLTCLVIALPLAWLFARRDFPGKPLAAGLLLIPMILPPFVSAVGIKMIFARVGALSTLLLNLNIVDGPVDWLGRWPLLGIVLLEALHLFPVLYLNLVAALANIDPSLEEAAANQGAAPLRVFRRITLPLAAPGLFAGLVLTFIWSFTELGTPLVFGLRHVLPVMIYDRISEIGSNPSGYAQVTFVLALSALGFWIGKRLTRQGRDVATLGRGSVGRREPRLSRGGALLAWLLLGGVLALAVVPHLSVVLLAVTRRWFLTVMPDGWTLEFFQRALTSELTRTALLNSLGLSVAATLIDLAAGFAIAWVCVRSRLRIGDGIDALAMLPLAVPGLVLAFGYLGAFGAAFRGSALFDPRVNPLLLLAISYGVRRLPFMVRAAHAGLEQVSPVYEEAAANLGATPFHVVRRITLPLVSANLLAGGILCFAFSMLEVSDSLILAQSEPYYPITKAIYAVMDSLENGINVAAALGVWAMALLAAALLWTAALLGKRMGQMFRAG